MNLSVKRSKLILICGALFVMVLCLAACSANDGYTGYVTEVDAREPARAPAVLTPGSGVTVIAAADWASDHPDIYASYMRNTTNFLNDDYVAAYPYISVLYEGMGFAHSYKSARGHVFSLEDLDNTGRPTVLSNCFACKTPNLHALINEEGNDIYKIPYEELKDKMVEPVSCFNCHSNEPGQLIVTHKYIADALGKDFNKVDPVNLACGQCHIEYYFDPKTRVVTPPYSGLSTMNPDDILKYFNNLMVDGKPFADYVNPRSGVRQIKVQHPEFETYLGAGSQHAGTYNCADCHMGGTSNDDGKRYISHFWTSPLNNPELIESRCSSCHGDLERTVKNTQGVVKARTKDIGTGLADLMEELVLAVNSGRYSDEQLDSVRKVMRDAQFYWDFVFVENSNGAHNSSLTHKCLNKAEALLAEAREKFSQL